VSFKIELEVYRPISMCHRIWRFITASTCVTAYPFATLEVVKKHVIGSTLIDGPLCVTAEFLGNSFSYNPKSLTKLVDEAKRELAVAHCGPYEEESWRRSTFVVLIKERRSCSASLGALWLVILMPISHLFARIAPIEQFFHHT
jgi:hypothetical protein